jgi:glycosyltransferase involved in cell wall biosynthesis
MPAYNYAHFLREAVDSILSQDYPHIELIVIDDGSTDGTREVLASYGSRLWWESQANAGQATTINRGWARAAGDLVGYLNADDLLAPGAVTAAVAALRARPDAIMSYCDFAIIDGASRETRHHRLRPGLDLQAILRSGYSPFGPGSFVRREAAALTSGWDPSLTRVPDFEYWMRLARLGAFVHVPQLMASFRVHEQSISFAAPPMAKTEEAILVIERFYASSDLPPGIVAMQGEARAMARMTAAQGHFRARRWGRGVRRFAEAVRLHPSMLGNLFVYRLLVSGVIGQFVHRRRSRQVARRAATRAPASPPLSES